MNEEERSKHNFEGYLITGSSNLTRNGLQGQQEFNVEIKDYGYEEAVKYFEELWDLAIPITEITNAKVPNHNQKAAVIAPLGKSA